MHNRLPQMGYYHKDLNTFVYNDDQGQLGEGFLSDLWNSARRAVSNTTTNARQDILNRINALPDAVKQKAMDEFLRTGSGEAAIADAKATWLQQQQENARIFYIENKSKINMALGAIALGLTGYIVYRNFSGKKQVAAVANPRRRRRKHKRSR